MAIVPRRSSAGPKDTDPGTPKRSQGSQPSSGHTLVISSLDHPPDARPLCDTNATAVRGSLEASLLNEFSCPQS